MNKIDIENKLNELKHCNFIQVTTNDNITRIIPFKDFILNDKNISIMSERSIYDFIRITGIEPSPLED